MVYNLVTSEQCRIPHTAYFVTELLLSVMVLKQNPGCHKFKDYGNRCDNMADDTIHVLLSTGNREGHRMMRVVVGTM